MRSLAIVFFSSLIIEAALEVVPDIEDYVEDISVFDLVPTVLSRAGPSYPDYSLLPPSFFGPAFPPGLPAGLPPPLPFLFGPPPNPFFFPPEFQGPLGGPPLPPPPLFGSPFSPFFQNSPGSVGLSGPPPAPFGPVGPPPALFAPAVPPPAHFGPAHFPFASPRSAGVQPSPFGPSFFPPPASSGPVAFPPPPFRHPYFLPGFPEKVQPPPFLRPSPPLPKFLRKASKEGQRGFFAILDNEKTIFEQKNELKNWAKKYDIEKDYSDFVSDVMRKKAETSRSIAELLINLPEAQKAFEKVLDNNDQTREEQRKALKEVSKKFQKETRSLYLLTSLLRPRPPRRETGLGNPQAIEKILFDDALFEKTPRLPRRPMRNSSPGLNLEESRPQKKERKPYSKGKPFFDENQFGSFFDFNNQVPQFDEHPNLFENEEIV
ncbi:unnamed protein product [Caenorhabditis auriculariae]|uniref:SXP/RAL-2 family protein Ani s 5-like cation-binding domain-containing protein n=1 Tax=Caenorhabditis auriculariae TaxID=2777116 RepID=A0A8S1HY98_9PELO|nr:unnamed protein product [Caenorhabditis auriculariae]